MSLSIEKIPPWKFLKSKSSGKNSNTFSSFHQTTRIPADKTIKCSKTTSVFWTRSGSPSVRCSSKAATWRRSPCPPERSPVSGTSSPWSWSVATLQTWLRSWRSRRSSIRSKAPRICRNKAKSDTDVCLVVGGCSNLFKWFGNYLVMFYKPLSLKFAQTLSRIDLRFLQGVQDSDLFKHVEVHA